MKWNDLLLQFPTINFSIAIFKWTNKLCMGRKRTIQELFENDIFATFYVKIYCHFIKSFFLSYFELCFILFVLFEFDVGYPFFPNRPIFIHIAWNLELFSWNIYSWNCFMLGFMLNCKTIYLAGASDECNKFSVKF